MFWLLKVQQHICYAYVCREQNQRYIVKWKTILKSIITIVERGNIDTLTTQIYDRSLSSLGIGTSIKGGGIKRVLLIQASPISKMIRKYKVMMGGSVVVVIVWYLGLQLPVHSVPITTNVVSSNPTQARCTRYIMW